MIHFYRAISGGSIKYAGATVDDAASMEIKIQELKARGSLEEVFWVCDGGCSPRAIPSRVAESYNTPKVYEIDVVSGKFVLVWHKKGVIWVQIQWKDDVFLEDVTIFTPTPSDLLQVMLILAGHTDKNDAEGFSYTLIESGVKQALEERNEELEEAADALRPYLS